MLHVEAGVFVMRYSLGLDIGSESVGWSVVELNESDDPIRLVRLGVRAFDAVRSEAANATTPAEERRVARSQRRRLRNRKRRLREIVNLFAEHGLVGSREELEDVFRTRPDDLTPWQLRVQGLDRRLEPREWARALFHIARHRGFKSTRRGEMETVDAEEKKKLGEMLSGIKSIHDGMVAHGYRTVAEYMESPDWPHGEQRRNKGGQYICTIGRDDLLAEARTLFDTQRRLGNPHASLEMEQRYIEIVDEPPHLTEGPDLMKKVGRCFLEPDKPRAPRATFTAQKFMALQTLVNQTLTHSSGARRRLDPEEIALLFQEALEVKDLKYKRALKALCADDGWLFEVRGRKRGKTLADMQSETLLKLESYHKVRSALEDDFPQAWEQIRSNPDLFDEIASRLTYWLRPDSAHNALIELGIEEGAARKLADSVVFDGHARLSLKAMRNLIPYLEQGKVYSEACELAGYNHSLRQTGAKSDRIPPLDTLEDFNSITNPNVKRALTQTRKVVNAIVAEYGLPTRVVVELAREAALSPQKRREIEQEQLKNRREKERIFERIRELAPAAVPERVWRKYLLYEQQGGKCAYSLQDLDLRRVLTDQTYTEIDHAIPRSVSFDDSMANKVLVLTEENRNKGDELAAVYVKRAHGDAHFERYAAWVQSSPMPPKKKRLLLTEELSEDQKRELQGRYLTATQFAAKYFLRIVKSYLDLPETRVLAVNGRMTNDLRWRLGLGEEKNRQESDKHHAIDATLCAIADHKMVHRMARYFKARERCEKTPDGRWIDPDTGEIVEPPVLEPWPGFRDSVIAAAEQIVVSRMPNRRLSGRGHKETLYSLKHVRKALGELPKRGRVALSGADPRPTKRTKLSQLSDSQIREILKTPSPILVDEEANWRLYELIRQRLREAEHETGKTWAERAFGPQAEPLRMPTNDGRPGPIVRSIRLFTDARSGIVVRGGMVENDTIVRLDIYRKANSAGKVRHYVVPVYAADVAAGWIPNRAAMKDKPESEWPVVDKTYEFLFSLHPGDCFRVWKNESQPGPLLYMTSFDRNSVRISGNLHDRSNRKPDGTIDPVRVSPKLAHRIEKVEVSITGEIAPVRRTGKRPA
ncbi:MAG: type II CRISPR RNA-guided endonuclease Cas9 [Anaerosomatales bacterium]|nr:type II CRISPR RNA-guided endonuclease Cas9 [Anaerosomatales bacterium]